MTSVRHFGLEGTEDRDDAGPAISTPLPPGVEGFAVAGRRSRGNVITVALSACCGALPGDWCDCASWAGEAATAPVVSLPPFDLPAMLAARARGEAA